MPVHIFGAPCGHGPHHGDRRRARPAGAWWTWPRPSAPSTGPAHAGRSAACPPSASTPPRTCRASATAAWSSAATRRTPSASAGSAATRPCGSTTTCYTGWNSRLDEIQAMVIRVPPGALRRRAGATATRWPRSTTATSPRPTACSSTTRPRHARAPTTSTGCAAATATACAHGWTGQGVDVGIYYDPPLHRHELAVYCRASGELAEAERAGREVLTLPIHAALPFEDATADRHVLVRDFLAPGKRSTSRLNRTARHRQVQGHQLRLPVIAPGQQPGPGGH